MGLWLVSNGNIAQLITGLGFWLFGIVTYMMALLIVMLSCSLHEDHERIFFFSRSFPACTVIRELFVELLLSCFSEFPLLTENFFRFAFC